MFSESEKGNNGLKWIKLPKSNFMKEMLYCFQNLTFRKDSFCFHLQKTVKLLGHMYGTHCLKIVSKH